MVGPALCRDPDQPSRTFGEIATGSSGRQAVRLDATGQLVEITATRAAAVFAIWTIDPIR